ncbi:hypothetical protein [Bartonella sp. AU55XJBT]|uniref:hypothetical protein n=1 Tax=Bartonella sp. AU55XJBT TaxID=3019091 RepID=UPI0023620F9B|nr:hypothetical protein [Bartonella sp. AU55XJBT]
MCILGFFGDSQRWFGKELLLFSKNEDYSAKSLNPDDFIDMVRVCLIQALVVMFGIRKAEL